MAWKYNDMWFKKELEINLIIIVKICHKNVDKQIWSDNCKSMWLKKSFVIKENLVKMGGASDGPTDCVIQPIDPASEKVSF